MKNSQFTEEEKANFKEFTASAYSTAPGSKKDFKKAVRKSIIKMSIDSRKATERKITVALELIDKYWEELKEEKKHNLIYKGPRTNGKT